MHLVEVSRHCQRRGHDAATRRCVRNFSPHCTSQRRPTHDTCRADIEARSPPPAKRNDGPSDNSTKVTQPKFSDINTPCIDTSRPATATVGPQLVTDHYTSCCNVVGSVAVVDNREGYYAADTPWSSTPGQPLLEWSFALMFQETH